MTNTENATDVTFLSEMTDEQYAERFALISKRCHDLATGFARPTEGEPLPLLNTRNWPIATEAMAELIPGYELPEYAAVVLLMLADHLRLKADAV